MNNQQDIMRMALGKTIASAWIDPEFKSRLFANPRSILMEAGLMPPPQLQLLVMENTTQKVHITLPAPWADTSNPEFIQRMQTNPKAILSKAGIKVPKNAELIFLENTNIKMHIVLPVAPGYEEISIEKI